MVRAEDGDGDGGSELGEWRLFARWPSLTCWVGALAAAGGVQPHRRDAIIDLTDGL